MQLLFCKKSRISPFGSLLCWTGKKFLVQYESGILTPDSILFSRDTLSKSAGVVYGSGRSKGRGVLEEFRWCGADKMAYWVMCSVS